MHHKNPRLRFRSKYRKGKHLKAESNPFTEETRASKKRAPVSRIGRDILTEEAIGDGNCAFNAFSLGLFTSELITQLEQSLLQSENPNVLFKEFIHAVSSALEINNDWNTVKSALLSLRDNDDEKLQRTLAPILRNLSVYLARKDNSHLTRTEEPLKSAFRDYVERTYQIGDRGGVDDDVFNQHDFIERKFKKFLVSELGNAFATNHFNLERYLELKTSRILGEEEEIELTQLDDVFNKLLEEVQDNQLMNWWKARILLITTPVF